MQAVFDFLKNRIHPNRNSVIDILDRKNKIILIVLNGYKF